MKRAGRWILRLAVLVILLPCLYIAASLAGALIPSSGSQISVDGFMRVGLLRGPIHYDFLLPTTPDTRARYAFAEAGRGVPVSNPDAAWLIVGWGSEAFYTTAGTYADITASAVLTAATGDDAVMRVDVLGTLPESVPGVVWLMLTDVQYTNLLNAIDEGFARDGAQNPLASPAPGLTTTDGFWRGTGHFSLLRTCNVWVGERLRAAGLRVGVWTPTPQAVDLALRFHTI